MLNSNCCITSYSFWFICWIYHRLFPTVSNYPGPAEANIFPHFLLPLVQVTRQEGITFIVFLIHFYTFYCLPAASVCLNSCDGDDSILSITMKSYAESNSRYAALKNNLNQLCKDFADWLPIEPTVITEGAGKGNKIIFKYTGPLGFRERKDDFTVKLLKVLQEPVEVQDEPPVSPYCKNPLLSNIIIEIDY